MEKFCSHIKEKKDIYHLLWTLSRTYGEEEKVRCKNTYTHTQKIKTFTYLLGFIEGNKPEAKENDYLQEVGVTERKA